MLPLSHFGVNSVGYERRIQRGIYLSIASFHTQQFSNYP